VAIGNAVRLSVAQDHTRIVLESNTPIRSNLVSLTNPEGLVIDLEGTELNAVLASLPGKLGENHPYIKQIRIARSGPAVVRLELDLKTPAEPRIFALKPEGKFGHRFVLDIYPVQRKDPVAAIRAFLGVTLDRIADPSVPTGCFLAQSTSEAPVLSPESRDLVRVLLARQHDRVRSVLMSAGLRRAKADELTSLVVAVNQSLGVLSRAGSPAGELRSVVRATCAAVGDAVQRTGSGSAQTA